MAQFKRIIENFTCKHCKTKVKGKGYTNHCPNCLHSRHVDINPGDRKAECGGMMEPVNFELKKSKYILVHKCAKCGTTRRNKMQIGDNFDILPKLSEAIAKKTFF